MKAVALTILGTLAGYAAMVVLITLVQEGIFGGVAYGETPLPELLAAGLLTMASAFIGGAIAAAITPIRRYIPAIIMSLGITVETTALILTGRVGGPLWFDIAAAASLMVAIGLGAYAWTLWSRRGEPTAT